MIRERFIIDISKNVYLIAPLADRRPAADDVVLAVRSDPHREVALCVGPLLRRGNPKAEHRTNPFAD